MYWADPSQWAWLRTLKRSSSPSGPPTRAFYKQQRGWARPCVQRRLFRSVFPASTTMAAAAAAATSAAAAVFPFSSSPHHLLQPDSTSTSSVSFPRLPLLLPAATLGLSAPSHQLSQRGLAMVPAANPKYHNAKADAADEEVNGEELLRRFTWQVSRAGVMEEIRRRRRHEDARDKRKRKARSAARRFRRRRFKGPYPSNGDQEPKEKMADDEENDNWELPGGELPSYR